MPIGQSHQQQAFSSSSLSPHNPGKKQVKEEGGFGAMLLVRRSSGVDRKTKPKKKIPFDVIIPLFSLSLSLLTVFCRQGFQVCVVQCRQIDRLRHRLLFSLSRVGKRCTFQKLAPPGAFFYIPMAKLFL